MLACQVGGLESSSPSVEFYNGMEVFGLFESNHSLPNVLIFKNIAQAGIDCYIIKGYAINSITRGVEVKFSNTQ